MKYMVEKPKRVKIQYYKKLPPNTKKVTRGTRFGNEFKIIKHGGPYTLEESLYNYNQWLFLMLEDNSNFLEPLKGKDPGCFCKLEDNCHADIILKHL